MTDSQPELAELERFVVDNEDLQKLEATIGRFNIFDALRIERAEIRHSNFLAWLLDPAESHGQGDLFLKAVLMDMLREARGQGVVVPISPVEIDGAELQQVSIRREWRNIDLLIVCETPRLVVCIENKMHSHEWAEKLQKYEDVVAKEYKGWPALFVFLNPEGEAATDADWMAYSFASVHKAISRARRISAGALGGDVGVAIDHYLNLIGSRFMKNSEIERLCKSIYANHRRAIELIMEHASTPKSELVEAIRVWAAGERGYRVREWVHGYVQLVPTSWLGSLSEKDAQPSKHAPCDLFIEVDVVIGPPSRVVTRLVVGPGADAAKRFEVIKRLGQAPFALAPQRKVLAPIWTRVGSKTLLTWDEEQPPIEEIIKRVSSYVEELAEKTKSLPEALKDLMGK
ncbi:MAG: PD-(D/E)XK nuclease family protein [Planctomycetes bacterium]|nr:PD-(D/E)XK nuclease family protein [Planctomycetota bacterium]